MISTELRKQLIEDGFGGDNKDTLKCLEIDEDDFDKFWKWSQKQSMTCRPLCMDDYPIADNRCLIFIPDDTEFVHAKLRWS